MSSDVGPQYRPSRRRAGVEVPRSNGWTWFAVPLCFALWRIAYAYAANADQMPLSDTVAPTLVAAAFAAFATALAYAISREAKATTVLGTAIVLVFYSFGAIDSRVGSSGWTRGLAESAPSIARAVPYVVTVGGIALLWSLLRRRILPLAQVARFARAFGAALLIGSVCFAAFSAARVSRSRNAEAAVSGKRDVSLDESGSPDIYVIVLDRYMAKAELSELGYDNSAFIDSLREKGFYVADRARSNYAVTYASLGAMLDMRYLTDLTDVPGHRVMPSKPQVDRAPFYAVVHRPSVVTTLKGHGYRYVFVPSGWGATNEAPLADDVLPTGYDSEFSAAISKDTVLAKMREKTPGDLQRYRDNKTFEQLRASTRIRGPKLVFAHVLLPHPPYVFEADGSPITQDVRPIVWEKGTRLTGLYLGQVQYANKVVMDTVSHIIERSSRPSVIVVMGDHGGVYRSPDTARNTLSDKYRRKHSILYAVRLPDGRRSSLLTETSTPVNTFRVVFDECFGADMPLLEDRSYYSATELWPYWPKDVTAIVSRTAAR